MIEEDYLELNMMAISCILAFCYLLHSLVPFKMLGVLVIMIYRIFVKDVLYFLIIYAFLCPPCPPHPTPNPLVSLCIHPPPLVCTFLPPKLPPSLLLPPASVSALPPRCWGQSMRGLRSRGRRQALTERARCAQPVRVRHRAMDAVPEGTVPRRAQVRGDPDGRVPRRVADVDGVGFPARGRRRRVHQGLSALRVLPPSFLHPHPPHPRPSPPPLTSRPRRPMLQARCER
jgi:hypothetical protein